MSDPLRRMVGGSHYLKLEVSPFEFAHRNQWDSTSFSILKYLTRFRDKNGLQDVQKARHIAELRVQFLPLSPPTARVGMSMSEYIERNKISGPECVALMSLEAWVRGACGVGPVLAVIDEIIRQENDVDDQAKLDLAM